MPHDDRDTAGPSPLSGEQLKALLEQSSAGFYVIQGGRFTYLNPRFAQLLGYDKPETIIGREVAGFVAEEDRDRASAIIQDCLSGAQEHVGRFEITALRADGSRIRLGIDGTRAVLNDAPAMAGLAQDITARERQARQIRDYLSRLERAIQGTLNVASRMVELRDPYTFGHDHRVGRLCAAIGGELGLDQKTIEGLHLAGSIHDVGKIAVPAEILAKPGRLTAPEFALIQEHPRQGSELLRDLEFPWPLAQALLQHHERLDGSGYPSGLEDAGICIEARVLAVADTVEAMASHRPYRAGFGVDAALSEIEAHCGRLYDEPVARACCTLFRDRGYSLAASLPA